MSEGAAEPIRIASDVSVQMAFACENISTDPMQRVTFHNVVDQLNTLTFPTQTPLLYTVWSFRRTVPGFLVQCKVEVVPASGDPVASQDVADISFSPDQMTMRHIVGFQGITWPAAGDYDIRFTSRGKPVASFGLRLVQLQLPGQPAR